MGSGASYLQVGELDANLDVVTLNTGLTLSILKGDGVGGFAPPLSRPVGNAEELVHDVALGDIDHDGDQDIVALTQTAVSWYLNDGTGGFSNTPGTIETRGSLFSSRVPMMLSNFDADPALDLGYPDHYNTCFHFGTVGSGGAFSFTHDEGSCASSIQVTGGDARVVSTEFNFDGDGFRDFVVYSGFSNNGEVSIVRGNGDGTWITPQISTSTVAMCGEAACAVETLATADLNGDDEIDLLAGHEQGFSVSLGASDGTFGAPTPFPGEELQDLEIVDMNGDGHLDVVAAALGSRAILVYVGDGEGSFEVTDPLDVGVEVTSVAVGDANDDGAPDVFTCFSSGDDGAVAVFLANP